MQLSQAKPLRGTITVPGDKSISHRAVMFGALAQGTTHITGFLMGEDCLSTIDCFRRMGVPIEVSDTEVVVHGVGLHGLTPPTQPLYTGNSGTTTRLLCGILAGQDFDVSLSGDASIQTRPMGRVITPLRQMGAVIDGVNGNYCPLTIHAGTQLHGIEYAMPVASAQLKSAILLAGLYADSPTSVIEPAPSRDHTERMLRALGANVESNGCTVRIYPPKDL
ncbi:MAG: 3-phosphoshikimate 1-carboxyvinyltransferase, partial [Butyricicoccus sp.]|nr:3-phosphoshikimate 1-carboxyvinyltransferase [Butyricicoccus sp.]